MSQSDPNPGVRVKICGITSVEDACMVIECGADAIGLNFVGGPRQIAPDPASRILEILPPMVSCIALVRLENGQVPDELLEVLGRHWVSHLQLYGGITPEVLEVLRQDGFRPIPVVQVADADFTATVSAWWAQRPPARPAAIVLDAFATDRQGGTGQSFHWPWVRQAREAGRMADWPPLILAGGLTPENVAEAIRIVQPYAVDVSSGVEVDGRPGKKDPRKVARFIQQAKACPANTCA